MILDGGEMAGLAPFMVLRSGGQTDRSAPTQDTDGSGLAGCNFQVVEVGCQAVDLVDAQDERDGVTGGTKAQGRVGRLHGVGEDGGAGRHKALEFLAGDVEGLLTHAVDLLPEVRVGEPAAQGGLGYTGETGGLGNGGREGDDRKGGPLAVGEAGVFDEVDGVGRV